MKAKRIRGFATGAGAVALGLTIGAGGLAAQPGDELAAGIFEGTCGSPGDNRLFDLGDLEATDDDDRGRTSTIAGTPVAGPVFEEEDDISASIDELTATPHVVLVFASDAADAPVAACGEITGEASDGRLRVTLEPVDGSGIGGVATFRPDNDDTDDDDDQTEVLVQVQRGVEATGTPTA